jgi:hypothetical protein
LVQAATNEWLGGEDYVEKQHNEKIEYEKPEVKDFGDLRELTAGGFRLRDMDSLWPNQEKAKKDFS